MGEEKPYLSDMFKGNLNSFYFSVFESSLVGQIVVKEDTSLESVNKHMFKYFGMDSQAVDGIMFGNLFKCGEIGGSGLVCGHAPNCKNCDIINGLNNILNSDVEFENISINHDFIINGYKENKWFNVCGYPLLYMSKKYAILSFLDITQHKCNEILLKRQLKLDLATGAINKYTLMEVINEVIETQQDSSYFTICMIDFDYFKEINDGHGHLMGDKVLRMFSKIASRNIRSEDILGRYGGEEFVIIFKQTKQGQALRIMKRIHKELGTYFIESIKQPVTFSGGLLQIDGEMNHLSNAAELIGSVDKLLYQAKKSGRNRVAFSKGVHIFSNQR
jgi:diguanylate cyclase (GGDEF)-like protein